VRKVKKMMFVMMMVLAAAGCTSSATKKTYPDVKAPTALTVKCVRVDKAPTLDASGNDAVWKNAPPARIPTAFGPEVILKSIHTDDMIYFLAEWKDTTPQTGRLWWIYDGTTWKTNLNEDDKISFIWNIDHSVNGFDKDGCASLCHIYDGKPTMKIEGKSVSGKVWPGYKQKADAWKWAPGVMQEKHVVDDGLFSAGRNALANPQTMSTFVLSLLFDGGDAGTKQWWTRNPNAGEGGGVGGDEEVEDPASRRPAYMLRPGYDIEKHPFPNMRDMVQITDYSIFKAGDKVPMIVYFDLTSVKNKVDFPQGHPSGSRMDITGLGRWKDNAYTLEFGRKLDTKHDDDVQFKPDPTKPVADNVFGLAVFNDTRFDHRMSPPVTLILEP
jgi:hypothetical protein